MENKANSNYRTELVDKKDFTQEEMRKWKLYNFLAKGTNYIALALTVTSAAGIIYVNSQYHKSAPRNTPSMKEHRLVVSNLEDLRSELKDTTYHAFKFPASTNNAKADLTDKLDSLDDLRKDQIKGTIAVLAQDSASIAANPDYQKSATEDKVVQKKYLKDIAMMGGAGVLGIVLTGFLGGYSRRKRKEVSHRQIPMSKG